MEDGQHIDPELLARHAADSAAEDRPEVTRHLQHCRSCAELYVRCRVKSSAAMASVPDSIWPSIESRLQTPELLRSRRRRLSFVVTFVLGAAACAAVIAAVSGALERRRGTPARGTLEVGQYLAHLERTDTAPDRRNLSLLFADFAPYGRSGALQQTKLRSEVADYRLVEERISRSAANMVQLVYESDMDTFALFIVPRVAIVNFGNYRLLPADVGGMPCHRVECPRQDVYVLTTGERQYVFLRRHNQFGDSDRLFAELIRGAP